MEQEKELRSLGEDIRRQGRATGPSAGMKDLVYDPETGMFKTVEHSDTPPQTGEIVTEMTNEGFAQREG